MTTNYTEKTHLLGRIFSSITLVLIFLVPTIICFRYDIFPPMNGFLKGLLLILPIYIPIAIAEVVTYSPILGSGGSYLVFITGNLTNLKIPCAKMCMESANVEPGTQEGEVISTISVAISSMVTMTVIFLGMLLIIPLEPVLRSPELAPAFNNIMPALFGALGAYFITKDWKIAMVPLTLTILIFVLLGNMLPSGIEGVLVPVMGGISVLSARIMYKAGFFGKE